MVFCVTTLCNFMGGFQIAFCFHLLKMEVTGSLKMLVTTYETVGTSHKAVLHLPTEPAGDRTPSQFLRHLRSLVPNVPDHLLRTGWDTVNSELVAVTGA
jgi:hypothetical protein